MSNSNDLISSIYDCNLCKNLLVDPVTVPCGNNLCKHHLDTLVAELPKKATFYRCELCQEEHQIPNKGFMVNKQLHNVLELELQNSVFYKFFKKINETQDYMELIESLDINSDKKITEFFDDLKAQVDSRRMLLIDQIEKESSAIVESINNTQTDIMKKSREANRILKNIKNPKSEFQELLESLSISDQIEENKFEKLRINLNYIYDQFSNRIKENDAFLSRNTKDRFNFEFEEKPISEVFGQYVEVNNSIYDFDFHLIF